MVGTILLLGLTVTLFSSIFFFVSTFPTPSPQPADQFSARLVYNAAGTQIVGVNVLHLAGPTVPTTALVYLYASGAPTAFPSPFTVASGLNGSTSWNLGQSWYADVTSAALPAAENLTISVVTSTQLLFRVTLPGQTLAAAPTFVRVLISPTTPQVGEAFSVSVQITDPTLNTHSVYANLSLLPGIPGTGLVAMTFSAVTGLWSYNVASGTTSSTGTFYLFVNATDASGIRNSIAFTVTIEASASAFTSTLGANTTAPVKGVPVLLSDYVAAGGAGASVTVSFLANGAAFSNVTGSVPAGSTAVVTATWTPSLPGSYLLEAVTTTGGTTVTTATLNLTVFPRILFVAHNVLNGVRTSYNSSAYLAQELTAAGVPFTSMFVACTTGLPASTTFNSYGLVLINFGSNWASGCPKAPSTTEQAKITGASGPSFLLTGAFAFGLTTCTSYTSAYFSLVGAKWTSSGTCVTVPNATASVAYAGSGAIGLRSDGVPATLTLNKTLSTSSQFVPYDYFSQGVTGTAFLKAGTNVVGDVGTGHSVGLAADPALLTTPLPSGSSFGTGQAGAALLYNLIGYMAGLSSSSSSGRALADVGLAQVTLLGLSHTRPTTVYVGVRDNGPAGTAVVASLRVNGTLALYNGVGVTATSTVSGTGGIVWLTLTWQAPSNGPFTLSVSVASTLVDLYVYNDQMPLSILNQATTFT